MSEEELKKIKLNCLTDFQRAAMLCLIKSNYMVFMEHGLKLLKQIGNNQLLTEYDKTLSLISKLPPEKSSDRILTLGILASI